MLLPPAYNLLRKHTKALMHNFISLFRYITKRCFPVGRKFAVEELGIEDFVLANKKLSLVKLSKKIEAEKGAKVSPTSLHRWIRHDKNRSKNQNAILSSPECQQVVTVEALKAEVAIKETYADIKEVAETVKKEVLTRPSDGILVGAYAKLEQTRVNAAKVAQMQQKQVIPDLKAIAIWTTTIKQTFLLVLEDVDENTRRTIITRLETVISGIGGGIESEV